MRADDLSSDMRFQRQLTAGTYRLRQAQEDVTSGDRLRKPSTDPAGYARKLGLQTELDNLSKQGSQLTSEVQRLDGYDSLLGEMTENIRAARTLAQRADNGATDPSALANLGEQVDRVLQQQLQAANREDHGRYLLSGTKTDTPAFSPTGVYQGDRTFPAVRLGDGRTLNLQMHGEAVASGNGADMFATLTQLRDDLKAGNTANIATHLDNLNKIEDNLLARRGEVGAASVYVDRLQASGAERQNQLTSQLTELSGADLATSITSMMEAENHQQAMLSVAARRTKLSLVDYLR